MTTGREIVENDNLNNEVSKKAKIFSIVTTVVIILFGVHSFLTLDYYYDIFCNISRRSHSENI